jgi:hypothetical protein
MPNFKKTTLVSYLKRPLYSLLQPVSDELSKCTLLIPFFRTGSQRVRKGYKGGVKGLKGGILRKNYTGLPLLRAETCGQRPKYGQITTISMRIRIAFTHFYRHCWQSESCPVIS